MGEESGGEKLGKSGSIYMCWKGVSSFLDFVFSGMGRCKWLVVAV